MKVFAVPGTERIERFYRVVEDRIEEKCLTVLVAVTRPQPYGFGVSTVVAPRLTKDGHYFYLFRVPKDQL